MYFECLIKLFKINDIHNTYILFHLSELEICVKFQQTFQNLGYQYARPPFPAFSPVTPWVEWNSPGQDQTWVTLSGRLGSKMGIMSSFPFTSDRSIFASLRCKCISDNRKSDLTAEGKTLKPTPSRVRLRVHGNSSVQAFKIQPFRVSEFLNCRIWNPKNFSGVQNFRRL